MSKIFVELTLCLGLAIFFSLGCTSDPQNQSISKAILKDSLKTNNSMALDTVLIPSKTKQIDYDTTVWKEITAGEIFKLDIKYATEDNFMDQILYPCGRCFLRPAVAEKLELLASMLLEEKTFGIVIFDCYRPLKIQEEMWEKFPNPIYVTDPKKGSMHNRGAAVDIGLFDLATSEILDMGTAFDHFGKASAPHYQNLSSEIKDRRSYLKSSMEKIGFKAINSEWWHFSLSGTGSQISNWQWPCPE